MKHRLARTAKAVAISLVGGYAPQTGPCDPLALHGYFGRKAPVTQAIKNWMLGCEFARDIQ